MPKLVDYSDRFDGIREAVYLITLDEGVGAISLDAVAPRAFLSRRTLQRLINSAAALPYLGLQWAERIESRRALRRLSYRDERPDHERAVDSLISTLPGDADLQDRTVWWLLVTAFEPTTDWAREARSQHARAVVGWSTAAVTETVADPGHESRRLAMIVNGAVSSILTGDLTHAVAADLIRRHVGSLTTTPSDAGEREQTRSGPSAARRRPLRGCRGAPARARSPRRAP
jgi:uncharacterized protein YjiS (DUF1127 family)